MGHQGLRLNGAIGRGRILVWHPATGGNQQMVVLTAIQ
jgi:hypothetical protein